jgi:hypothetical protein
MRRAKLGGFMRQQGPVSQISGIAVLRLPRRAPLWVEDLPGKLPPAILLFVDLDVVPPLRSIVGAGRSPATDRVQTARNPLTAPATVVRIAEILPAVGAEAITVPVMASVTKPMDAVKRPAADASAFLQRSSYTTQSFWQCSINTSSSSSSDIGALFAILP